MNGNLNRCGNCEWNQFHIYKKGSECKCRVVLINSCLLHERKSVKILAFAINRILNNSMKRKIAFYGINHKMLFMLYTNYYYNFYNKTYKNNIYSLSKYPSLHFTYFDIVLNHFMKHATKISLGTSPTYFSNVFPAFSGIEKRIPRNFFYTFGKRKTSHGAKSGFKGGCSISLIPAEWIYTFENFGEWLPRITKQN